eukprot:1146422-Pyramimonas_sp.AAC.1
MQKGRRGKGRRERPRGTHEGPGRPEGDKGTFLLEDKPVHLGEDGAQPDEDRYTEGGDTSWHGGDRVYS